MAGGFTRLFLLSLVVISVSNASPTLARGPNADARFDIPPSCSRLECPNYEVVDSGKDFEIRRYSVVLASTSSIVDEQTALVRATRTGFNLIFDYIHGHNDQNKTLQMTAPVFTEVEKGSTFVVDYYIPKAHQANSPVGNGLHVERFPEAYAAVRRFGGFVTDSNHAIEAAALRESLKGNVWEGRIMEMRSPTE